MTASVQPPAIPDTVPTAERWFRLTRPERQSAISTLVGILIVFAVAFILTPDERGIGTHQQLGLPPCMAESVLGIPCPFCGMTTSFAHMAHGDVGQAVAVQPAGALGFVAAAALAMGLLGAVVTGKAPVVWRKHRYSPWVYAAAITVIGAAWVYKILSHTGAI